MLLVVRNIETPIGMMVAIAGDQGMCVFDFVDRKHLDKITVRVTKSLSAITKEGNHPIIDQLQLQIGEYFTGRRFDFDVPIHPVGSPFQLKVWEGLRQIPYGATRSYKLQSTLLGDENAIRAVASANGANGIAMIIPCHRVIGTKGNLTGYGGGLWRKQWLLEHEAKYGGNANSSRLLFPTETRR